MQNHVMNKPLSEVVTRTGGRMFHFGIKGMKWGVRRERGPDGTVGGGHPASEDAIKAVKTQMTINKTGTLNSVSSKDLKQLVDRMDLEKRYVNMTLHAAPAKKDGIIKRLFTHEISSLQKTGQLSPGLRALHKLMKGDKKGAAGPAAQAVAQAVTTPRSKPTTSNPFSHPNQKRSYPKGSPFNMRPNPAYKGPSPLALGTPVYKIHTLDN